MRSHKLGKNTSEVEVHEISPKGFWLWIRGKEFFLSHKDFPWFQSATADQIAKVKLLRDRHLYWPDLDVDLEVKSLEDPAKYPLISN